MKNNPLISVIVPLHNEEASLAIFLQSLCAVLAQLDVSYEIILIDDGSADNTWELIENAAKAGHAVRGLRFTRNFGKEAALLAGLRSAKGDAAIVMDGDGQHPPDLIPAMFDAWRQGYAIAAAYKQARPNDSWMTLALARLFGYVLKWLSGLDLIDSSDFRLLDRAVIDALLECPEKIRFFRGMTSWTGFSTRYLAFSVPARIAGDSRWSRLGLAKMALHALISYSAKPLYYLFGAGLSGLLLSFILALQALYSWIEGIAVSGWTSLTLVMLFFGSANLLGLGILGIYLAQLFDEVKARPAYLISESVGGQKVLSAQVDLST
jgi:glycosyltransferase involved in cell wall biosynthesis